MPSNAVTTMLTTGENPLVALTLFPKDAMATGRFIRGMGFISEKLGGNRRLIVTCRHAFMEYGDGCRLFVAMKNPRQNELKVVGRPILDSNPENDIAFLVVRDHKNAQVRPLEIKEEDPPISEGMTLYNAGNQTNPSVELCDFHVLRQPIRERRAWGFTKCSDPGTENVAWDDQDRQAELIQNGYMKCRSLNMISRGSFSGSPIWDEELRLYGMDIRGSDPGTEAHAKQGDMTICLPTSELYLARRRMDAQIQEVASF